jgi:hypothetical protein
MWGEDCLVLSLQLVHYTDKAQHVHALPALEPLQENCLDVPIDASKD